jgi:uncharacterized protein (TIGR02246 family)
MRPYAPESKVRFQMANAASTADRHAIERLMASLDEAWARGDAEAYADRFVSDGTFTNFLGMFFQGREAFRERHDAVFKSVFKGTALYLEIAVLRFIGPDVAVVDLNATLKGLTTPPRGLTALPDGAVRTKLLMVLVRKYAEWWISAYHNVAVTAPPKN